MVVEVILICIRINEGKFILIRLGIREKIFGGIVSENYNYVSIWIMKSLIVLVFIVCIYVRVCVYVFCGVYMVVLGFFFFIVWVWGLNLGWFDW